MDRSVGWSVVGSHILIFSIGRGEGGGTVPQEGDIFDCFRNAFFPVCMINLGYSTHVFSMGTFLFQLMSNTRTFEFFNGQKLSKM